MGLKPITRRVWVRRGVHPLARSFHRYEWLYVYGFVHPASGRTEWMILPEVNVAAMNLALDEFARTVRAGPRKQIILVMDRAGWHESPDLVIPRGLHLVFLPPYTPELQPAERLWPLLNEALANQPFANLDALETRLVTRCRQLLDQEPSIQALTRYHWWAYA